MLEPEDQQLISGFVVNKFRGDPALLAPGLTQLQALTGRPTYGVIPYDDGLWLDAEDSLSVHGAVGVSQPPRGADWLRIAAIRSPRISDSTDIEALACEPGVLVRWVSDPADLADADVVVIPGSKATVADLNWPRERGLADGVKTHAGQGKPVLGICGGFQMLCRRIDDPVESKAGVIDGLGNAHADIVFAPGKTLRHHDSPLGGYEIHHGRLAAPPGRLARVSASVEAMSTARTGMACWTITSFDGAGRVRSAGPASSWPTTPTCPPVATRNST